MSASKLFLRSGAAFVELPSESHEAISKSGLPWVLISADSDETLDLAEATLALTPLRDKPKAAAKEVALPRARTVRKDKSQSRKGHMARRKRCPECGELFTRLGIGPHMVLKHKKYVKGEQQKSGRNFPRSTPPGDRLECPVCHEKFFPRGFSRHVKMAHPAEARAASKVAAADKEREVKGSAAEQLLRDIVAGRRSVPDTSLGQAIAEAAKRTVEQPST